MENISTTNPDHTVNLVQDEDSSALDGLNPPSPPSSCCKYCQRFSMPDKAFFAFLQQVQEPWAVQQYRGSSSLLLSLLELSFELLPSAVHLEGHFPPLWLKQEKEEVLRIKRIEVSEKNDLEPSPTEKLIVPVLPYSSSSSTVPPSPLSCIRVEKPSVFYSLPLFTPSSLSFENPPLIFLVFSIPLLPSPRSSSTLGTAFCPFFSSSAFSAKGTPKDSISLSPTTIPHLILSLVISPFMYWAGAACTSLALKEEISCPATTCSSITSTQCLFHSPSSYPYPVNGQPPRCGVPFHHPTLHTVPCWLRVQSLRPWLLFFCQQHGSHKGQRVSGEYKRMHSIFSSSSFLSTTSVRSARQQTAILCDYIRRQWLYPYSLLPSSHSPSSSLLLSPFPYRWYEVGMQTMGDEEACLPLEGVALLRGHPRVVIEALAIMLPPTARKSMEKIAVKHMNRYRWDHATTPPSITSVHTTRSTSPSRPNGTQDYHRMAVAADAGHVHHSFPPSHNGASGGLSQDEEEEEEESVDEYNSRVHAHWCRLLPYIPTAWWPIIAACCGFVESASPPSCVSPSPLSPSSVKEEPFSHEEHRIPRLYHTLEKLLWRSSPPRGCMPQTIPTPSTSENSENWCKMRGSSSPQGGREHVHLLGIPRHLIPSECSPPHTIHSSPTVHQVEVMPPDNCPRSPLHSVTWWREVKRKIHFLMSLWCRVRYPHGRPFLLRQEEKGMRTGKGRASVATSFAFNLSTTVPSSRKKTPPPTSPSSNSIPRTLHKEEGKNVSCMHCPSIPSSAASPPYFVLPFFLLCRSLSTAVGESTFPAPRYSPSMYEMESHSVSEPPKARRKVAEVKVAVPENRSTSPSGAVTDELTEGLGNAIKEMGHHGLPSVETLQYCQGKVEEALANIPSFISLEPFLAQKSKD